MAKPILPSVSAFVTAAIDAVVAARPETLQLFNQPNSNWGNLPAMWRAQALLLLAWLGDSVKSARLKTAKADALRALCASEFRTQLPPAPQTALAQVSLFRPNTLAGQGTIRAGTKFVKAASPTASPLPIQAATYTTTSTTYVSSEVLGVTLSLLASASGSAANLPSFLGVQTGGLIQPASPLFDPSFTWITSPRDIVASASGGSDGLPDPVLVAAAKAFAIGQFGPTQGALIAGLLAQQSVRRYAVFPASLSLPYAQAYIGDQSWASSPPWISSVAQAIANQWTGFGCRIRFGSIVNRQIAVSATIVLKSTDDLNSTDDIDANVRSVAESYFNDRPDWYRFRVSTLRSLLSSADPRIRHCTGVAVTDAVTGQPVVEPQNTFTETWTPTLVHPYLTDSNCQSTYLPPT